MRKALIFLFFTTQLAFAVSKENFEFLPSPYQKNKDFWVRIYSHYDSHQGLIHDAKYIDHIYEVVDLRKPGSGGSVRDRKKRWKTILLSLHQKQRTAEPLTSEEKKVFDLFQDIDEPNKFLNAAHRKRLRFQLGQKDRFLEGLYHSGRYLPAMEKVFKQEGMPEELTRLPFVESSFNLRAYSKVGASGIWQFMRSTAQLFLSVNEAVDERNDPIRATEAAAKLLKLNYSSLKSWPLAVTAYNHGRKGVMRAIRKVGSDDLDGLIAEYRNRSFGFASSNFFAELLAAVEVEKNAARYFGPVRRAKPLQFVEVEIPDYIKFQDLIKALALSKIVLKELNPALSEAVFSGRLLVPAGYQMRIPCFKKGDCNRTIDSFWESYSEIPARSKRKAQVPRKYDTSG